MEESPIMCNTPLNKLIPPSLHTVSSIPLSRKSQIKIKTKKCQPVAGVRPDLIQTEPVPSTGHGQHTPRVTARSRSRLSGHTPHTPRVTVVVPVSGQRLARKQTKNKQNVKTKNIITNYQSHSKSSPQSLVLCSDVSLPVANKLLCSVASLPVANKLAKVSVKHPDDKWLTDVLTKTTKCQPAVRDILSGHTLHTPRVTVVVPVSSHILSGHTPYTPRVTMVVPVSSHKLSGHTLHTPRVTVVVPVSSHIPHTPRVTVKVPGSGRSRKQNKNKQNEKYKIKKANYLSHVTLVNNVKHTKLFKQSKATRDITKIRSKSRSRPAHSASHCKYMVTAIWSHPSHSESHCCGPCQSMPTGQSSHTPRVTVKNSDKVLKPRSRPDYPHTPRVTVVPVKGYISKLSVLSLQSRSSLTSHGRHTPRVTANSLRSGHGQHTPRVTAKSRTRRTGHGQQTPRVTANNVKIPSSLPRLQYLSHSVPVSSFHFLSRKEMNKLIKQQHGNGKNSLIICHWNLGSKKWKN